MGTVDPFGLVAKRIGVKLVELLESRAEPERR